MPSPALSAVSSRRGWVSAAKLPALFLVVMGAKFGVMRACSSALPFFDQWEGEGGHLLQPWMHGRLRWADLFTFHVQHRIALTRLLVLGLFQANDGQWDTQVEMIVAAGCHALCAVALGAVLIRRLGPAMEDRLLLVLALLFGLPFDWENTLSGGFQSQFYFLLGLSFVTIRGLGSHRPGSAGWWTGVGAAMLSWVSMASAPLAPLAVAGGVALRRWRPGGGGAAFNSTVARASARADGLTLGTALGLFAAGMCVNLGVDPGGYLHPKSAGGFLVKFLGLTGWPNPTPWAAPLAYGPFLFLLARRLWRPRRAAGAADAFLVPLGLFALLQTAALAFARNQYRGLLVSRYMDILSIGAVVNFACLLQFAGERQTARGRVWLGALGAGWVALTAVALSGLTAHNLKIDLPFMHATNANEEINVAILIAHPNPESLKGKGPIDFQCKNPETLLALLQDPLVHGALPADARAPLALAPVVAGGGGVRPVFDEVATAANRPPTGWMLDRPAAGARATVFRSQTIDHALPFLAFAVRGEIGPAVRLGLVGERTGRTWWVWPPGDAVRGNWWAARVATPPEPFHVEAAVAAGADGGLTFLCPREMGTLSVWVDPLLDSAAGLMFAGVALWLMASFGGGLASGRTDPEVAGGEVDFSPLLNSGVLESMEHAALLRSGATQRGFHAPGDREQSRLPQDPRPGRASRGDERRRPAVAGDRRPDAPPAHVLDGLVDR